jgi:hypothetical protein
VTSQTDESVTGGGNQITRVNVSLGAGTIALVVAFSLVLAANGYVMGLNMSKQDRQDKDFEAMRRQYERAFIVLTDQNAELKARK